MFCFTDQFAAEVVRFLNECIFNFYKVGHFSPSTQISKVHFELDSLGQWISAAKLFGVSSVGEYKTKLTGMPRRAEVLFELLEDTDVDLSFAAHNTYESNTFKEIARHVLCRLGEVVLDLHQFSSVEEKEASFSGRLKKYVSNLKSAWLGIGKKGLTWYGYPDARVRVCNSDVPFIARESHHEQSPGDSIVETKLEKGVNLMQLVAMTVVAAFVEKNVHPNLLPIIPSILITPNCARICIYDVTNDLLLISEWFTWVEEVNDRYVFNKSGMLFYGWH